MLISQKQIRKIEKKFQRCRKELLNRVGLSNFLENIFQPLIIIPFFDIEYCKT